jgi:general secretion pathway protein N
MSVRAVLFAMDIAISLALAGSAAAQTRLALTSPNVGPDPLDNPIPSFSRPPEPAIVPAAPRAVPSFGVAPRRPTAAAPEPRGNPLWGVPLKELTFTRDRPLFTPSRRPPSTPVAHAEPPPAVAPKPAEPELPKLTLIGVVLGEKDGIGIFLDSTTKEVIRLRKNEGHGGWILRTLQGREATLEKAASTAVLVIPPPGGEPVPATLLSGQRLPHPAGPEPQL